LGGSSSKEKKAPPERTDIAGGTPKERLHPRRKLYSHEVLRGVDTTSQERVEKH